MNYETLKSRELILKKSLETAVAKGFAPFPGSKEEILEFVLLSVLQSPSMELRDKSYYGVIFSHEFAKKFFVPEMGWQKDLQAMVVYEEPLDYLEKLL